MTDITELAQSMKAAANKAKQANDLYLEGKITLSECVVETKDYLDYSDNPNNILALLGRIAELEREKSYATFQPIAARDVLKERLRQITEEGWTPEHDDQYSSGELARAAACYAEYTNARGWIFPSRPDDYREEPAPEDWLWDESWWKPVSPRRDLVRAGALILAEIDRLDRKEEGDQK